MIVYCRVEIIQAKLKEGLQSSKLATKSSKQTKIRMLLKINNIVLKTNAMWGYKRGDTYIAFSCVWPLQ